MNKNVTLTKKRLTIIFTMIVFIVVLLLGITFLSFKYLNDLRIEKASFLTVVDKIESGDLHVDNILNIPGEFHKEIEHGKGNGKLRRNLNPRGFINHILVKNNLISSSNIKDNVTDEFISDIMEDDVYKQFRVTRGFLIKKINLENEDLILFKRLRYGVSDYSYDILVFIFINLLFSSILYFIGYKFVNKAFIPVEENIKDMNDFVHNAGHEFKTPLSVIDSNIQLIKDSGKYNEEMLDEIKSESKSLNSLIDSLVRLSDIDSFESKIDVNLRSLIEEILANLRDNLANKKIKVKQSIDKDMTIKADRNYVFILLSNLIGNAIKYNKDKGTIQVSYDGKNLTIKDSGIGIPKDELTKIFDRFYKVDDSRSSEGFGIGLSLVRKIAEKYKWTIKVDSKEGEGTSFKIKL